MSLWLVFLHQTLKNAREGDVAGHKQLQELEQRFEQLQSRQDRIGFVRELLVRRLTLLFSFLDSRCRFC